MCVCAWIGFVWRRGRLGRGHICLNMCAGKCLIQKPGSVASFHHSPTRLTWHEEALNVAEAVTSSLLSTFFSSRLSTSELCLWPSSCFLDALRFEGNVIQPPLRNLLSSAKTSWDAQTGALVCVELRRRFLRTVHRLGKETTFYTIVLLLAC